MIVLDSTLGKRWLLFSAWIVLSAMVFVRPLISLVRLALSNDNVSYLILIPFITAWILFMERHKIFHDLSYSAAAGRTTLVIGSCLGLTALLASGALSPEVRLSIYILALVFLWIAGFASLFGAAAYRAGEFPLMFLFLMAPLPNFLLDKVIHVLQSGSAWITGALFDLLGVPALREGFVFHLAGANIEIAKECSSIRSSIVLLILALLVAHFRLHTFWKKMVFIACGIFMMVLKNGIRIASLTLLAMNVDPSFLTGRLHHRGGIVFFLVGLLLLWPILLLLQYSEVEKISAEASKPGFPI